MAQTRNKLPGYLENALKEASGIIYQAKDKKDAAKQIKALISHKLLDSFKNGITVGMKKAGKVKLARRTAGANLTRLFF
jgi:hypothetical protein